MTCKGVQKLVSLLSILFLTSYGTTSYPTRFIYTCPEDWLQHTFDSSRCYKLLNDGEPRKWNDAWEACQEGLPLGSYLFVPSSLEEEMGMQSLYQSLLSGESEIWIGCSDLETNTTFRCYEENEALAYNNWSPGNPDENKSSDRVNGATMNIDDPSIGWVQHRKGEVKPVVCELPATGQAITSFSQTYVIKPDMADRCRSDTPLEEPFIARSRISCAGACNLRAGCYTFNFIQFPGQTREGRCELMGADTGSTYYDESCQYYVRAD